MTTDRADRAPNRLIHETSPYLLQHAYNPVQWYPWGKEALARSRELDRPILLSIGYSSCHWCHVMERESFESERIAQLMNDHFVCIKVDREERPDLDEIYMQATLAMNGGQGGWPMTVFLTPEQEPIFAGTYFPPEDKYGRPGFPTVLKKISEFWRKDRDGLLKQAAHVTSRLKEGLRTPSPTSVGEAELQTAVSQYAEDFDARYGGFGGAPKFPPATGLSLLLRCFDRTKDPHTLTMVRKTLDAMAAGGMYDQLGGGFARYSTDERWLVPHFEKMLYDNALLARIYVEAYQVTQDPEYRRVASETLDYILREMTSADGGFYSATDADSEGVEGKFFVWTPEQIHAALPNQEDTARFCAFYDVTAAGNWEHTNVLNRPKSYAEVARDLGISEETLRESIARSRPRLYAARAARVPPGLDDKVITAWNGMMISAMAEAGRAFGEPRYAAAARRAADFILGTLTRPDDGLFRTYREGKAHLDAYLEDYAYLAEALIDVYEGGAEERYLTEAARLAERMILDFGDEQQGGFYTTARRHENLIIRSREGPDGATPSGNAVAASALARLAAHLDRQEWKTQATAAVRAYGKQMARYPRAFAKSLAVVDFLTRGPVEVALIGAPNDPGFRALAEAVGSQYLPNRIIASVDPRNTATNHPLLRGKSLVDDKAALYVCRNFTCQQPVTDAVLAREALRSRDAGDPAATREAAVLGGRRLPGSATVQGTAGYAGRNIASDSPALAQGFTIWGRTGLTGSRLGFGTYRVATEEAAHRDALIKALRAGCNVIDTSTNYMDGDSERLVGSVLAELIKSGDLTREEVIVVSKIGYVQGNNLVQAQAREKAGQPYPDMVKYGEGIWHCVHPDFLADQLAASLDRLGLDTLDVCLLHNPEYFLSQTKLNGKDQLASRRDEFYRRLRQAFGYLESQVAAGRLRWYGVSSNTVIAAADDPEVTSLSRMVDAAKEAAGTGRLHHFAVLQCPMNLYESGAALTANTGSTGTTTPLALAQHEGVAVLVNRPLNAMSGRGGSIMRLADVPVDEPAVAFDDQRARVAKLEEQYRREIAPSVQHSGQGMLPGDFFNWAEDLAKIRGQVQGLEHWEQIELQMIAPHVNQVLRALSQTLTGETAERWETWRDAYVPELLSLLKEVRREASERSRARNAAVGQRLDPLLPAERRGESLSRKALWVLASTPGVTCVLNGMRSTPYVKDSLQVLRWEPLNEPLAVFRAFAS
ncbi:MAG TPA: aldo/keto reductase [Nitrospiraceae bacterium]|nr:aldo/keto reductase [Nitrospiraceae bacterium]